MEQGGGRQLDVLKWLLVAGLFAIGVALLRLSRRERRDARLLDHPVPSPRDGQRIAVCGTIEPEGEPLTSPVRDKPAVLYHFSVYHLESRRDAGIADVVDFAGYGAMPFRVAGVAIASFPILHDFDVKGIDSDEVRSRMKDFIRFAPLEHKERGKIEWLSVPEPGMWDGHSRVTRAFTRGESRPVETWRFNETVVSPDEKVCAIGVWSKSENALTEPWLYRGTKETVRETLATSVGCGRVVGVLLIAGAIALAAYLVGLF